MISAADIETAFPPVPPGIRPFGPHVLVQLRHVRKKTESGLVLVDETRDLNRSNTQIAKVISMGAIAYKNRDTMADWPEGAWCKVGDIVRVPKYGGDRLYRRLPDDPEEQVSFALFKDHEIYAGIDAEAFEDFNEIL